ncbi:MAG TPA: hypothetical protein DIT40_12425 [Alphaproteobacteria bacterium]|jgi:putative membrane protein|nr:hypothetical protein [Alphaproteobacteria bacterium]HBC53065.1 hypothetical protein [Alphaproteobacteria bacterium]HCO91768.1 hypothetical protein [Alphaproteobacteria bacterium]
MDAVFYAFLAGFPVMLLHLGATLFLLAAGLFVYMKITPYDDLALIRSGNVAAAISLSGASLGIGIPLAFSMANSISLLEVIIWGSVALVLQILGFRLTDLIMRDLPGRIVNGEMSAAILLVSVKLSIAVINAAALSG